MITITHDIYRRRNRHNWEELWLLKREYRVFGIIVWRTIIDSEVAPSWAMIQRNCLGSTDWESRLFKQYRNLL